MTNWITCPNCGVLMTMFTGGYFCPLCGYRVPVRVHTATGTGRGYIDKDIVEVIRCKDCKHNESGVCSWHCSKDYTWCVDDDDYCSVAERKEE